MLNLSNNEWLLLAIALFIVIGIAFFSYYRLRDSRARLDKVQADLAHLQNQLTLFNEGAVGIGRRLVEAERQLDSLSVGQSQLMRKDEDLSYTKANELIASGADVKQLMEECQLPQAEAELMLLIHRQLKSL